MTDQVINYAGVNTPAASRTGAVFRDIPWARMGLCFILILYAAFVIFRFAPAISEPDDNGYFAQGSLLYATGHTVFKPQSPAQYIGMHWLVTPDGTYISRYPPGLAVLIAGVYAMFGYKGAAFINPALSILALPGLYLLGKRLFSRGWALIAIAALAINPTYAHHALSGDAHMGVTFCLIWGTYFLLSWAQDGKLWQIFSAGVILGCIPTVRYPDAIIALGVIAFLAFHFRRFPRIWRHYLAAIVGAAIPVMPLLIRNQILMGAFWRTGYSLTNEETGFGWNYFSQHWQDYIQTTLASGGGYLLALGIVGIVWMICLRNLRAFGIMLALFTVPFTLLYMAYYWGPQGRAAGTMRFLLPTFPVYILAATWMLSEALRNGSKAARIAVPIVLLIMQSLWGIQDLWQQTGQNGYDRQMLARLTEGLDQVAHDGDVIMATNHALQHFDFVRRWKLADPTVINGGGTGGRLNALRDPESPFPMQAEKQRQRADLYTGTPREKELTFADDIQTWAAGHKIYLAGAERTVNNMLQVGSIKIIKHIPMPVAPPVDDRGNRGGFGGPGGPPNGAGPGGVGDFLNFANRRGGRGLGGAGGGGPMGNAFAGEKELVIAEWTPPAAH